MTSSYKTMPPERLAHAIKHDYLAGFTPFPDPVHAAYSRFPTVRQIIDRAPHNTFDDIAGRGLTADVLEQILRFLLEKRS